jgi:hypothetical protein
MHVTLIVVFVVDMLAAIMGRGGGQKQEVGSAKKGER